MDFLGAHAFEPVIARVEFAHVIEAEPAPFARPVEPVRTVAGRTEFPRLAAARRFAGAACALDAAMESW